MAIYFQFLFVIIGALLVTQTNAQSHCAAMLCMANTSCVECASPQSCQSTCANPTGVHSCPTFTCSAGCVCATNYVRNSNGQCVKLSECPATVTSELTGTLYATTECGANEHYYTCKPCARTCEHPLLACAMICADDGSSAGCACNSGYVRSTTDGNACVAINSDACLAQRNATKTSAV